MMKPIVSSLAACCALLLVSPAPGQTSPAIAAPTNALADRSVLARANALIQRMTLREKLGQMTQIGPGALEGRKAEDLIRAGEAGSVLWTIDSNLIHQLQDLAVHQSRLGIPLLFGFDVIHGYKTAFPVPLGMAATWDPALVETCDAMAAKEAAASGINWTFAPMVDIARDARWGRIVEGAGEDPYLGERMAAAQVRGFQGPTLGTPGHVLACMKHFAAYGAGEGGRDYDSCYVPEELFNNVYLRPFRAAVNAGVGSTMSAYMCLNDLPASGNRWLMQDMLRDQLAFRGFVISDSYAVASLVAHGLASDPRDATRRALQAGVNMDMASETYWANIESLVKSGEVPMARIDDLVREILAVKIRLGLFENPFADLAQKDAVLNNAATRVEARLAAQRAAVLLRNEGHLLPLRRDLKRIAVIGPSADSDQDLRGPWTVEGNNAISVLAGLQEKFPAAQITCVHGGDMQRAYALAWDAREGKKAPPILSRAEMENEMTRAVAAAKEAELVVMVLGERPGMAGENASASTLALQGNQQELLERVVAVGRPVVLVLVSGRPLDLSWADEHVPAILAAWFPGDEGGRAIADLLVGDANPGGKLPLTWPRATGQCPIYYNHNLTQAHDDEACFTSRYADRTSAPLYPFGHGLSYTNFTLTDLRIEGGPLTPGKSLSVTAVLANVGARAGDEVVQLYVHQRTGDLVRPARELKGFSRVTLQPGETCTLHFVLSREDLAYWHSREIGWKTDAGLFDLWLGTSSIGRLHQEFEVKN